MKKTFSNTAALLEGRKDTITEAGKYLIVGGICTLLDFSLLFVLTHSFKLHYLLSSVISFMAASVLNYSLCKLWIFKVNKVKNRNLEIFYYVVISVVGLGINFICIWVFTAFAGLYFMLSKLVATAVTFWWNFGARKYFLHTNTAIALK